jgi:hypothetical protein
LIDGTRGDSCPSGGAVFRDRTWWCWGCPEGGPVAYEVAIALGAPLDVIVVRKLGLPFQPELAMGAIGEDGVRVLDADILRASGVEADELREVETREQSSLRSPVAQLRRGRPRIDLNGRAAVIVTTAWRRGRRLGRRAPWHGGWERLGSCWPYRSHPPTRSAGYRKLTRSSVSPHHGASSQSATITEPPRVSCTVH